MAVRPFHALLLVPYLSRVGKLIQLPSPSCAATVMAEERFTTYQATSDPASTSIDAPLMRTGTR